MPELDVLLANPRGFCAGVDRAIAIVEQALAKFGAPIYVRHEVVHNKFVVDDLKAKGAIFIEDLSVVPPRQHRGVLRPRRAQVGAPRGRGARLQRLRCDVSARDQGARRDRQDARCRPRNRHDRPCRPSRGRRHDGAMRRRRVPGRVGRRRRRAGGERAWSARVRHANHAVGRRCRGHRRGAAAPFPRHRRDRKRTTSATRRRTGRTP